MIDSDVEADDGVVVLIRNEPDAVDGVVNDLSGEFNPAPLKRKRGKHKETPCDPDVNGKLTIVVHLITTTSAGDQLTRSRKNISIEIEEAACYIENIDLSDARNNISRPYITARSAHGLIINHFGQYAAETLTSISDSFDPYLAQKLKINSNPKFLVCI